MLVNELAAALAKAQLKIKSAEKDSNNPHFKSGYASLQSVWDACRDALAENNLCVTQSIERDEMGYSLKTMLLHMSGQAIESSCPLILSPKQDMQALGSAITYARRYALAAIVGVVQKDDDGHEATKEETRPTAHFIKPSAIRPAPARGHESSSGPYRFAFGKFKDKTFSELDPQDLENYIQWLKKEDAKKPTFEREKNQSLYEAYNAFKTAITAELFKSPFEKQHEDEPPGYLGVDL